MLKITEKKGEFSLWWQDKLIIHHSTTSPFMFLGKGEGNYKMRHGSFKISQKLYRKDPLKSFVINIISNEEIIVNFGKTRISFQVINMRLNIQVMPADPSFNRCWLRLKASPGEYVYGCGEQYSVVNLRGKKLPVWCEEQGIGRGHDLVTFLAEITHGAGGTWYTTYFPLPLFSSTANWYCFTDSYEYMEFDFRNPNYHEIEVWGIPRRFVIGQGNDFVELLDDITGLLGRQPSIPDWATNGVWIGAQGGRDLIRKKVDRALEAGVKVAAVWAQDWQGIRMTKFGKQLIWDWKYDDNLYPDLPGFISELKNEGIRFLGYINPFLATEGTLFREASEKGYLVRNSKDEDYLVYVTTFPAAMIDFTNPDAVTWIKEVIKNNMIGAGLSGWMADYAEYLPVDSKLYSGEAATSYHNKYPAEWARINREAIEESGMTDEVTFFSRSGYTGTSSFAPIIWAGDQLVNWSKHDGLPSVIPAGISLGLSGVGHYHSDMGGYSTGGWVRRSKELMMRWIEHATFTLIMRGHEGNMPHINWQYDSDAETLNYLAKMSRVYTALKPYRDEVLKEYQLKGLPVIRHTMIHYGDDPVVHKLQYQYMLGSDLLVAPVYKRKRNTKIVYLPEDNWIHFWTGQQFAKGWHLVKAPLGMIPVFYRSDSVWKNIFKIAAQS